MIWQTLSALSTRRRQAVNHMMVCILIAADLGGDSLYAQLAAPWRHVPKITVVGAAGDSRLRAVDEAVAFWNRSLAEIGSGFRLGSVGQVARPLPEEALKALSEEVLSRGAVGQYLPRPG